MSPVQSLTILGSTGSIGVNTLDVVARHPDRFRVVALSAHTRSDVLFDQCMRFRPRYAVAVDSRAAAALRERLRGCGAGTQTEVLSGAAALEEISRLPEVGSVMAAIVGAAGLRAGLAAAEAGKKVLLANKEALVMAGPMFIDAVRRNRAVLLPIDSEHNAIFQALPRDFRGNLDEVGVRRILLTASGGPFRDAEPEALAAVTPAEACAHPNWSMGRKISVDSATLMNKGLEVIEAHWLFDAPPERIQVVIHPQSVIHSMVEYIDGSVLAQLGNPDMRTPIAHALAFPERIDAGVTALDLVQVGALTFAAPNPQRFPCLGLAYAALRAGGTAPAILNAANEVAVAAFLDNRLRFLEIPQIIEAVMQRIPGASATSIEDILDADSRARDAASALLRAAA
jgi:1-deoxy-D-xylulose-5-phosphate reductoisomerase